MVSDPVKPLGEVAQGYSTPFLRAIDYGLAVRPEDRPQSIAEFRHALGLAVAPAPAATPALAPAPVAPPPSAPPSPSLASPPPPMPAPSAPPPPIAASPFATQRVATPTPFDSDLEHLPVVSNTAQCQRI